MSIEKHLEMADLLHSSIISSFLTALSTLNTCYLACHINQCTITKFVDQIFMLIFPWNFP